MCTFSSLSCTENIEYTLQERCYVNKSVVTVSVLFIIIVSLGLRTHTAICNQPLLPTVRVVSSVGYMLQIFRSSTGIQHFYTESHAINCAGRFPMELRH